MRAYVLDENTLRFDNPASQRPHITRNGQPLVWGTHFELGDAPEDGFATRLSGDPWTAKDNFDVTYRGEAE